jgi:hypothetical protein
MSQTSISGEAARAGGALAVDHPARASDLEETMVAPLSARIAQAHSALACAEKRLSRMHMLLQDVDRKGPEFSKVLRVLHFLERLRFSRQLELDDLLRERRRLSDVRSSGQAFRR